MVMHDALKVDVVRSLQRYADLHRNWDSKVNRLASHLLTLDVSCLLADAPYLTLAAAHAAKIPSAGICSLNWADILERCVKQWPAALQAAGVSEGTLDTILLQMRQAYASAGLILQPEPAMPMTHSNTLSTQPLAHAPSNPNRGHLLTIIGEQLTAQTGNNSVASEPCWIVLTSMGGIHLAIDPSQWPTHCLGRRVLYLTAGSATPAPAHVVSLNFEQFDFNELMASCDVVLTKPGYGMFVEARACGKPMLYLARDDWPESLCLEQWATANTHAIKLTSEQIGRGEFATELTQVLSLPALDQKHFSGADQAARTINRHLLTVANAC